MGRRQDDGYVYTYVMYYDFACMRCARAPILATLFGPPTTMT